MNPKVYPSLDEATHIYNGLHYKVGNEIAFWWYGDGWQKSVCSASGVKTYGTPIQTAQEAQQRTQERPATGVQGGGEIVDCKPAQDDLEQRKKALEEVVRISEELGLYNIPKMTEKNDDNRSTTCANNRQVGGDHYKKMKIQPWAADEAWLTHEQFVGHLLGSAIDYLARFNADAPGKGGIRDIEKAKHCLEKLIEVKRQQTKGI